jgi:hypothetical protein
MASAPGTLRLTLARGAAALLAAMLVAGCATQQWSFSLKTPVERVQAFLTDYYQLRFRGLPKPDQLERLTVHLSPGLLLRLQRAQVGQAAYAKRFPGDKPPLVEGDLFSSLFEGPTTYRAAVFEEDNGRFFVLVNFTHSDLKTGQLLKEWTDRYLVVQGDRVGGWLVEDVEYRGGWDFAQKGRLSEALEYAATYD